MLGDYARNPDRQYMAMHRRMMRDMLEKEGELDPIDWLLLGVHYSKASEEEVAYQLYYMAHLLDHERIGANSKLQFETTPPQQ